MSDGTIMDYVKLEKLTYLETEIVDATPGAFLPSKVLDIMYKMFKHDVNSIYTRHSFSQLVYRI